MTKPILRVYLQMTDQGLHPVSRQILTTARALGEGYRTQGVVMTEKTEDLSELALSGLDEILLWQGIGSFIPEQQADLLAGLPACEIFLFPATPEGRGLSAMVGTRLHTGVTADCTALRILEDGSLLQVRPAFSQQRLAEILTDSRPQIASLRFGSPVPEPEGKTEIRRMPPGGPAAYEARWVQRTAFSGDCYPRAIAVGGGIGSPQELQLFLKLAEKLGSPLFCSRALVDRGWMDRGRQIGLSGRSISAGMLVCFGISGSLQFRAGLQKIGSLIAVNRDPDAPLMLLADRPIQADLGETVRALL